MNKINLSEIRRTHSVLRYVFPFQSWNQFTSFAFFESVGLLCFVLFLKKADPNTPYWVFLCALLGGAGSLFLVLPASFEIINSQFGTVQTQQIVGAVLNSLGYLPSVRCSDQFKRYESKLPAWLRWRENEFLIQNVDEKLSVKGPIFSVRALHKKLSEI